MKLKPFLILDAKNIRREMILLPLIPVPLILALGLRFGFAPLSGLLSPWVDLSQYSSLAVLFIINLGPLLTGLLTGLLMVDEADEHILSVMAITPPGKKGFLMYRLGSPFVLTFFVILTVPSLSGMVQWTLVKTILLALCFSVAAPMEAMIIAVFAGNKIEAMAVGKMTGILFLAPFIAWFAPGLWKYLGGVLPGFWLSLGALKTGMSTYFTMIPALPLYVLILVKLLKRYEKRIES